MPSANANSMPAVEASQQLFRPSFIKRFHKHLACFFHRLFAEGRGVTPALPEELHGDIGFQPPLPERGEAFWQDRQRSVGRDLPL
ncbi:hypothetical protein D3C80_559330 [compost metagenome]